MHSQFIARYIIFIWLPLASFKELGKSLENRLAHNTQIETSVIGQVEERLEFMLKRSDGNGASHVSPSKISANKKISNDHSNETETDGKAQENINLKSALHVISNVGNGKNLSAVVVMSDKREKRTRFKELRGWIRKRKRRKKRSISKGSTKEKVQVSAIHRSGFVTDEEYEDEEDGEEDDVPPDVLDTDDVDEGNTTELGRYLGSPCDGECSEKLLHVFCDPNNRICECEKKYPVQIGAGRGCAKPKQLGDQCFYAQTCSFSDPNAICMQINHNAICQCKPGFHSVAFRRGAKRSFCSEDQVVVSTDLPTLLGVASGIAVLTGLICFVLKLFNSNRYPNRGRYNDGNIAPPLLFSSDNQWINGIPLTVHGRPSSRTSSQRSTTNLAQYPRSKGVLVPASRAGSRRPSISSIKSTTSSQKSMSYSARRFEQENQQKEQRAAMRAAREEAARLAAPPTPSPLSTDELLPCSKNEEDDMKSASPKSGSKTELSTKLSPSVAAVPRL